MERVNKIIRHELYIEHLARIEELEIDRIYCHHDMVHFLDVARIAMIISHEDNIDAPVELVYAAALLHDIGRDVQYETGSLHEVESAKIAPYILRECDFSQEEIKQIVEAIREHGNEQSKYRRDLTGIIYRADKLSRKCFNCKSVDTCHKAVEKRNMVIKY